MKSPKNENSLPQQAVWENANQILRNLNCSDIVRKQTESILQLADEKKILFEGNAKSLAAGIVYIAGILSEERMTLDSIAGAASISPSSVGKHYMKIARALGFGER